jgi:hypothetical protein
MRAISHRKWLITFAIGALVFAIYFIIADIISKKSFYRNAIGHPTPDITVVVHHSRITDNLFRSSSYWQLKHNADSLDKWLIAVKPVIDTDYPEGQIDEIAKVFSNGL